MDNATRRLATLSQHLQGASCEATRVRQRMRPEQQLRNEQIVVMIFVKSTGDCAGGDPAPADLTRQAVASAPFSSATGEPSSYAQIHGAVSSAPVVWRDQPVVSKELLQDVLYCKASEGIAKVKRLPPAQFMMMQHSASFGSSHAHAWGEARGGPLPHRIETPPSIQCTIS